MKNIINAITISITLVLLSACDDFIDIDPPITDIVSETVFSTDQSATSAIVGIYSRMINTGFASGNTQSVTFYGGLSSDELVNVANNADRVEFYANSLRPENSQLLNYIWGDAYEFIFASNAIIEGLANAAGVSESVKMQIEGEAKFIRAFCHFYLVNLFGDIPIVTTTNYEKNSTLPRNPIGEVYSQIVADLIDAQSLLSDEYITGERVRPNRSAATALLARVYLFLNDWKNAETQASSVINNTSLYSLESDLNNVFLANSSEAIWQLRPVSTSYNTNEGKWFILKGTPTELMLSSDFPSAFEFGDNRSTSWVGSITVGSDTYYFPYKYKIQSGSILTEYSMVMRLAELYLIRAEARAQQDDMIGAQNDLSAIRNRAGLLNTTATNKTDLLLAIEQERKVELFTEWAHRWLDLKRTNRVNVILGSVKTDWESSDALYPIPQTEIENNQNLNPQNPGY